MPEQLRVPDRTGLDLDNVRRLVDSFFAGRNERTLRAYRADLTSFCAFVEVDSVELAARTLLGRGHGSANRLALDYKAYLVEKGLAPATINRRLAAVRSLVRLARTLGLVPWHLEVKDMPRQPYRDTRGPDRGGVLALMRQPADSNDEKSIRDRAIIRLLFDLALRREEVVRLDVDDLDLEGGTIAILGNGRSAKQRFTLPEPTRAALRAWLEARGDDPGPLFINFDRAGKGQRLTGRSIHRLVGKLGADAGLKVRPHGLRHAAITQALDVTNGDVRAVAKYSRHRDLRVLQVYDDCRQDLGGRVAKMVAAGADLGVSKPKSES